MHDGRDRQSIKANKGGRRIDEGPAHVSAVRLQLSSRQVRLSTRHHQASAHYLSLGAMGRAQALLQDSLYLERFDDVPAKLGWRSGYG